MVRHDGGATFNRGIEDNNPLNADTEETPERLKGKYGCACIADRCAMWRWERTTTGRRQIVLALAGETAEQATKLFTEARWPPWRADI